MTTPRLFHPTVLQEVRDYSFITLGLLMYAIGYTCFQLPYQITSGGLAGISALLFYTTGLPVYVTFFTVNIILLIMAVKVLGWKFCVKTIYGVVVLTVILAVMQDIMVNYGASHTDIYTLSPQHLPKLLGGQSFMACVIGAAIEGIALGLVFLNNGSTGGTDIIAAIVNKYRNVSLGQIIMLIDIFIITSALFTPIGSLEKLLYGYTTLIIASVLLDYVNDRGRQSVQFLIFSRFHEQIAEAITTETSHSVTILNGMGWYTKKDRMVVCVLARKRESTTIFRIIQSVDPTAFVSQSKVIGVFGEGFDRIKTKAKKTKKKEGESLPPPAQA